MANRFSDYLTPDEFAQLMKTNPTAVTGNRELEAITQFKAEGGKLKGDLPQPPAASFDEWGGGFDHAEAAQKLMDDVENAETNLDYDATKEPWVGKAFNNTIEKIKDTQLYAQYMYSPEDWVDKGKEIFDVTGIDVNNLNDKELFNKAWNVTKEYKKKAAIYADENGHVNMDKVYEAMPYLRDIHEAHGTSAAVQVMRSAKQLQTINDLYDSEGARFLASLGYGAKGAAMQAGLQVYGAKAMLNGLLFGERLTDKQANDIMWFQKQLESIPEFSYTSVGGAVGGALGSAIENAPIMLPEMARTAAVALEKIPVPMAKALGVLTYAAMSTQIAGQQYIDNLLKTDDNGNPIYTPRQAALLSLAQGFAEGALEKRSIATAGKAMFSTATAKKLSEIYAKDVALAEGQTLSGATREAISNVVKERVRHGIKAGGVSFGAELEEEFEQKVSDMVLENMAQIAVRGDKADVASVGKILEDSFAEAAEAIPAVAGFSLLGVGGAVVNDAKTIHDTRKRFINSRANSIMNNYYINDEMKNILHGVADNLDNIADLEAKAPEVVEQILDTQNEKVGLKEVEVDIGELKQIGQTDVIDTIAKKANVSQEELMACLNGTGRLTVAFSKLQMATHELSDEGKKALDNNVSTVGGVTDRENKENVELLKMIADTMKKRTDEETSEVVSQFVQGTFADEETRKLAKEIIEADLSNPYEEVKRRQRDVASLIDEYLGDTIAQMKAEGGQGVDIVVGEEGRGTRVSNNPQWYRNFYADFGRAPTNEDYERLAYEFETGQATRYAIGSYGDVTPEEAEQFQEKRKFFDELFAERERLKNIQQSLEGIKKDDFLAYASLPVEARQVYHVFADALSQSDSADVRKSATANAIVASMIAHRVAEARRAHGENVSDLDVIPNIGSTEQGELAQMEAESEAVRKQYEGTDKWLKAPNGNPTNLTEKQWLQVRTPAFKAWFGDWENDPSNASKVVDENGEPLVMWHGSTWIPSEENGAFDVRKVGSTFENVDVDYNFFFTGSEKAADGYGKGFPVFLNIRKPIYYVTTKDNLFTEKDANTEEAHDYLVEAHDSGNDGVERTPQSAKVGEEDGVIYSVQYYSDKEIEEYYRQLDEEAKEQAPWIKGMWDKVYKLYDKARALEKEQEPYKNEILKAFLVEAWKDKSIEWIDRLIKERGEYFWDLLNMDEEVKTDKVKKLISEDTLSEYLRLKKEVKKTSAEASSLEQEIYNKKTTVKRPSNPKMGKFKVIACDNPNQIKSATGNNGNFSTTDDNIYHQFAGQKSLTANTQKLAEAMSMEQAGATANEIYKKTGWLKGKEGGWRYEIKDKLNSIDLSKTLKHKGAKLSDVYDNKELFDAYPQLKDIQVSAVKMPKQSYGETLIYDDGRLRIHINKNRIDEELDLKTTIVHEIAHCIQAIEGFANGASPSDVRDYLKQNKVEVPQGSDYTLYERIAGEQEAREVEKRARATMLLENKDKAIAEGDNSKKAKFARKVLAQAANRMPVPHKADAIVVFGDTGIEVSANVETPAVSAEKIVDEFLQSAWHGSRHLFKEFDLGAIGTGVGAQVYGYGLYFTENRQPAEVYRNNTSSTKAVIVVDGEEYDIEMYSDNTSLISKIEELLPQNISEEKKNRIAENFIYRLKKFDYDIDKTRADLFDDIDYNNEVINDKGGGDFERQLEYQYNLMLTLLDKVSVKTVSRGGALYEVEIPETDVMLDDDKSFKEQPKAVRDALYKLIKDIFPHRYIEDNNVVRTVTSWNKSSDLEDYVSNAEQSKKLIEKMQTWLESYQNGEVSKKDVILEFDLMSVSFDIPDDIIKKYGYDIPLSLYEKLEQEAAKNIPQEKIEAFDVETALREHIDSYKEDIEQATKELDDFFKNGFDDWFKWFASEYTGRDIYNFIDECMGSAKNASLLLNDYGIEGITYRGLKDGRSFVVFNDKAINIINTYNQKINGETKGSYSPTKHMLTLFKTADQSTFMHEMSHFYLSELMQIAKIDENSAEAKMLKTITDWAEWHKGDAEAFKGTASYNEFLAYEKAILEAEKKGTAKLNDKEYTKEQLLSIWVQEKFARGFETYLQSGEAPTTGLKRIFARFKQWLKKIYLAYTGAGVEPSSDVKAIMARMVATDEAIAMASIERKVSVLRNKLGDDVFEKDTEELREKWLQEAEEEAKAKLLARLIKQQGQKNIDEHMKAYEETIREQLTEENAFVVQALIEEGFTEEEAITGIYPSVDVWKKDLEAKGGSYEKAIENAVTEERERYKQEMPSEEELRSMAEEELISHTTELEAMEAEILARREKKYNELPAKVTSAIAEMDEALEFEESDNPLKLALTKLKYAYRWNEQQKAQIENMQKQIDALKEKSAEEKKHLKAELKTNLQAFKENTLLNKNWLRGVRDATKGKVKEIRAYATNNLMTMPIREATDTKRFIGEARKEAKTVLAKLTKAISGNKQAKISLSTETALSSTMQEAEAGKDNSTVREAYYAKIREAVYVEQARQSVRIKQGVEKMKARLTRIGESVSKDKKAEFDASAHYYIGHILYMTGITKKDARRPQTLVDFDEFIKGLMRDFEGASENETVDYKVPSWLKELAMSKGDADDYRAYRFGEMQDLTTLIVNIYTTARNKDRLFTSDKKASEVQKEMLEDYKHTVTVNDGKILSHELGEYLLGLIQPSRLLETLGGSYKKYIYDILAEANEKKKAMQQVAADSLNALFDKYWDANTRRKLRSEKDYVAPNGQKLSKENILVMALNWGNTGNITRVINTFSANIEDEGEALRVKSEIEKLFEDVLTARDWQFVQDVWQFIGAYGDRVSTVVETETGTPMKRVEAEPFEIATSDGLLINVDGGYYPIAYDTENATGYIDEEGVPSLSTAAGANGVFNANMGSTKDRSKEGVVGGKIRLDMDKLFAHVNQQIHIATMRLAWRDAYKLIKSRPIRETIVQTYGAKAYYSLKGWVEDCWSTPIQKRTWVEQITDKLRQRTVTAIMAYRVSTSILNLANPVYMAREIGAMNTLHALVDYYGNPKEMAKKRAWVKRQSSFMRNRAHNLDRDFNRTKTDSFDRGNPVRRLISQYGNYMIEETDLWFSIPTYYWTYKQAYNEELGNGTSTETAKKAAHRKAEDTVRRIFGSSETVDQSEIQRSRSLFMKAMTPFYTFASTQANHLFGEYLKSKYQGYNIKELEDGTIEREKKKFYKTYWGMFNSFVYTYVLGAFVEQAIRELISQIAGDDKDKKEKLKRMKQGFATRAFAQGVQSLGSGFPIGNIVASYVANEILGETYGASNFGMIDAAYSRYGQAWKDTTGYFKGKKDALEAGRSVTKAFFGAGLGIPDTLVDTAFNGARAYVDHYSVEDWFRKSLFDKRLKQKGK